MRFSSRINRQILQLHHRPKPESPIIPQTAAACDKPSNLPSGAEYQGPWKFVDKYKRYQTDRCFNSNADNTEDNYQHLDFTQKSEKLQNFRESQYGMTGLATENKLNVHVLSEAQRDVLKVKQKRPDVAYFQNPKYPKVIVDKEVAYCQTTLIHENFLYSTPAPVVDNSDHNLDLNFKICS